MECEQSSGPAKQIGTGLLGRQLRASVRLHSIAVAAELGSQEAESQAGKKERSSSVVGGRVDVLALAVVIYTVVDALSEATIWPDVALGRGHS